MFIYFGLRMMMEGSFTYQHNVHLIEVPVEGGEVAHNVEGCCPLDERTPVYYLQ